MQHARSILSTYEQTTGIIFVIGLSYNSMIDITGGSIQNIKRKQKIITIPQVEINTNSERKIVNIFLPVDFNLCCGCSKEPSQ